MSAETGVPRTPAATGRLSAEDFDTASIRSAAPSYVSEAPSYHSTTPNTDLPAYTPPASATSAGTRTSTHPRVSPAAPSNPVAPPARASSPPRGLPPVPTGPLRRASDVPSLCEFRIPSWSTISANPTARHYHNVAHRRVMATNRPADAAAPEGPKKKVGLGAGLGLGRLDFGGQLDRPRPLEDPALVGEVAAARARAERMVRENPDEILALEDKRWDWFLAQSQDWDERGRSWAQFRRRVETNPRGRASRRMGML